MAFVKLDKSLKGTHFEKGEPAVRMGAHRAETGRTIYVTITRTLVELLGWTIRSTEMRDTIKISLHEGVGEDAGFWLLEEDLESGYSMGGETGKRQAFTTNIQHAKLKHYVLNDDNVKVHDVEFVVQDKNALLVQMPDWLRYNPQSYQEPEKPKLVLTPPPTQPKKEDKKPSRPTIRVVVDETREEDEPPLNRKQRRIAASVLTKAMR